MPDSENTLMTNVPAVVVLTVGRSPECDIVVPHPRVSGLHSTITGLGDGLFRVADKDSANGTFLGEITNRIIEGEARSDERIFLSMEFSMTPGELILWRREIDSEPPGRCLRIGRDPSNDIVINRLSVAPFHAWLSQEENGGFRVRDLGSQAGTFLDGGPVNGHGVRLGGKEVLRFGRFELSLAEILSRVSSGQHRLAFEREAIQIDVRDLAFSGGGRRILEGIDLLVSPGQVAGIMGPSGCGKTTLLCLLAGLLKPESGEIRFNGLDLADHSRRFRPLIGYVPQHDELPPALSPRELLVSHGKIRSNLPYPRKQLKVRVARLLEELGLDAPATADVPIRSPGTGGLSGGQRKRLSLALELMSEPGILLLDEPTSGLSSRDAREVMAIVHRIAVEREIAVIFSLHQPSRDLFRGLDRVVLLQEGHLAFFGRPHPDAAGYFLPGRSSELVAPEDLVERLDERTGIQWATEYREHSGRAIFEQAVLLQRVTPQAGEGMIEVPVRRVALSRQIPVMVLRHAREAVRDREALTYLFLQAPLLGAFVSLLFSSGTLRDQVSWYFLGIAVSFWLGISHAVREIVGEQAFLAREVRGGLSLLAYLIGKFTLQSITLLVATALYMAAAISVAISLGTLSRSSDWGLLIAWSTALAGAATGLAVSALVRKPLSAVLGIPLILIPVVLMGGLLKRIVEMPPLMEAVASINPVRWAFQLVLPEGWAQPLFGAEPDFRSLVALGACIAGPLLVAWGLLAFRQQGR